jgi:outer membrane autotransporter protein
VIPQLQLAHAKVKTDTFVDNDGATVDLGEQSLWTGRFGATFEYTPSRFEHSTDKASYYMALNGYHRMYNGDRTIKLADEELSYSPSDHSYWHKSLWVPVVLGGQKGGILRMPICPIRQIPRI